MFSEYIYLIESDHDPKTKILGSSLKLNPTKAPSPSHPHAASPTSF